MNLLSAPSWRSPLRGYSANLLVMKVSESATTVRKLTDLELMVSKITDGINDGRTDNEKVF